MNFIPPNTKRIAEALGNITQLPKDMQMAVTNKLDESFQPVSKPDHDDWLSIHKVQGQTMKSFERTRSKAIPHATYKTIYIQPVGSFNHPRVIPLNVIIEFVRIFFPGFFFYLFISYVHCEECGCNKIPSIEVINDEGLANGIKEVRDDFLARQPSSNFNRLSATILIREKDTQTWKRGSVDGTLVAYPASTVKLMYMYSAME
ncbi:unnamed protein product [Rotaria sordida]|uniref:Uncharacterized protein n=1 Tax=Rotaria sordida TaxID=392033 RepID=A0A814H7X8_9BILA|nr:unnamed protein product [Rotaria sordida]CAF1616149.1 unnamed protein product [Rotaria sordida]